MISWVGFWTKEPKNCRRRLIHWNTVALRSLDLYFKETQVSQPELRVSESHEVQLAMETNKLKMSRGVTFFCIIPIWAFVITFSLQSLDEYRPHGTAVFAMFSFGVAGPATLFVFNKNLRHFAKKQMLAASTARLNWMKSRNSVHPFV